jgi:Sigma-70 region 3
MTPDRHPGEDELRDSDWASRSVRSRARRLQQAGEELTGRLGRVPTQAELAAELGTDAQAVHRLVDRERRAAYHAAIAACSDFRARLDAAPRSLLERAAEAGSPAPASA